MASGDSVLRSDSASVELRDTVLLTTLRDHPWSTSRMLTDRILEESGGTPALLTGALWIPPWMVYDRLRRLARAGLVERRTITSRQILWRVVER